MKGFAERQFRQFLARYQTHKDTKGLADAVENLRVKFEGADAEREADARPPTHGRAPPSNLLRIHQLGGVLQSVEVAQDPGFDWALSYRHTRRRGGRCNSASWGIPGVRSASWQLERSGLYLGAFSGCR